MKLKSAIFLGLFLVSMIRVDAMQPSNAMEAIANVPASTQTRARSWVESWLPNTYDNADQFTESIKKISKDGVTLNHKMEVKHELFGDPNTLKELNKTSVNMMKTYLTAGVGGALALSGIILLFKTLLNEYHNNEQKEDKRGLIKKIITNPYLISITLIASGMGIILKSDSIVNVV